MTKWAEQAAVTLTTALAALVSNGGGVANASANLDCRAGGNAEEMFCAIFELSALQWGTTPLTNVVSGTVVAELFLVPAVDGTYFADVDIANASTDFISPQHYVGSFINDLHNPVYNTSYRFATQAIDLYPLLYKPYLINRSGYTYNANAVLKAVAAKSQ